MKSKDKTISLRLTNEEYSILESNSASFNSLCLCVHPLDQLITGNDHALADTDSREGVTLSQFVDLGLGDSQYSGNFVCLESQG